VSLRPKLHNTIEKNTENIPVILLSISISIYRLD